LTAENIRIAVNQNIIGEDIGVTDGDEVAFFPPVTGG
jgi:molybdopterin converting factor small subunit